MTTPPRQVPTAGGDNSFEARLHEYLRKTHRLIPTTQDEVEAMEHWIAERDIEVPEELRARLGCSLTSSKPRACVLKLPAQSNEVELGLARAAREGGKPISAEVEERMKRDRERKEGESRG